MKQEKYKLVNYNYPKQIRENIDILFSDLDSFSNSNELISTYLGRNLEDGGMVVIPWNTVSRLINMLIQPTTPWYVRKWINFTKIFGNK
jgi:hypothetical protein